MQITKLLARRRPLSVCAAIAVMALGAGVAYANSITTTGVDTVATKTAGASLSAASGFGARVAVMSVTFPATVNATPYVLAAQGDMVNWGLSDLVRCNLEINNKQVAAVTMEPGQSGSRVLPFALTGAALVPAAGGTGVLNCWHDTTNGQYAYVDANASIWAHRTTSLTTGTE